MALDRSSVPVHLTWRVEDIFADAGEWDALYAETEREADFSAYAGRLTDAATVYECLEKLNAVIRRLSRLTVYAYMRRDEDTRRPESAAMMSRASLLGMRVSAAAAFIRPELTALPAETLEAFASDPLLADYDYTFRGIIKDKPHVLPRAEEELLAQGARVFEGYHEIFSMMDDADFPAPTVTVRGQRTELTHGAYNLLLCDADRRVRRTAFRAYYGAYRSRVNSLAAVYAGSVDKDVFLARARRYGSCLEQALSSEDVDERVYRNLLDSVHRSLPLLHRYFRCRRRLLGVRTLHMYDLHVSAVEGAELKPDYEEAFAIVREGLAPLGERYGALLQEAHDHRWIDVEETKGKRSGAYSISIFGLPHPYVLLNYQRTAHDVFTIAHELGHAMHSYHSERSQPQEKADYRIFVAEVASTVNEVLLLRHLLGRASDERFRSYLLSYYLDMLRTTLFRQTQFAEFEYLAHDRVEKGQPLTRDVLCETYLNLNRQYYGPGVVSDPEIAFEWARIPHFYRPFYVYKYATGIVSAVSIAERILREGEPAVADYFRFLSSGGSDSPVELLKIAGVDLTGEDAFRACMGSFAEALGQFERSALGARPAGSSARGQEAP